MKTLLLGVVGALALIGRRSRRRREICAHSEGHGQPVFRPFARRLHGRGQEDRQVTCIYKGPATHEPATEVQIMQDFVTQGVDGIAISVADADSVIGVIKQARDANIPVITFDADAPNSARQAMSAPTTRRWVASSASS